MNFNLSASGLPPTKPYLLRAVWEWCSDNGFVPHIVVEVDGSCRVPLEFVKDGQIVLNVGAEATHGLQIANDFIHFQGRFGGVAQELVIPVARVSAIYARENGAGMAFEVSAFLGPEQDDHAALPGEEPPPPAPDASGGGRRSHLRRIK
jgi:stringent starvation protein B